MKKNRHLFEIASLILAIVILVGCAANPAATPQPTGPVKSTVLEQRLVCPKHRCSKSDSGQVQPGIQGKNRS